VRGSIPGGGPEGVLYLRTNIKVKASRADGRVTDSRGRKAKGDTNGRWTGRGNLKKMCDGSCTEYECSSQPAHYEVSVKTR
jgi:hypothetical protein